MPDWIQVDLNEYETSQKTRIRGVEVELFASPYDVPDAIRGHYNEDTKRFVIEFKYLGEEDTQQVTFDHVFYNMGVSSGRLYGLSIDVDTLSVGSVGVSVALHSKDGQEIAARMIDKVTGAIDELIQKHSLPKAKDRQDNYKLAKDAILAKKDELVAVAVS